MTPIKNHVITDADIRNAGYVTNELLPCPFCGNKDVITIGTINEHTRNLVYKAFCNAIGECSATIHVCLGKEDTADEARAEVVRRWNKRRIVMPEMTLDLQPFDIFAAAGVVPIGIPYWDEGTMSWKVPVKEVLNAKPAEDDD